MRSILPCERRLVLIPHSHSHTFTRTTSLLLHSLSLSLTIFCTAFYRRCTSKSSMKYRTRVAFVFHTRCALRFVFVQIERLFRDSKRQKHEMTARILFFVDGIKCGRTIMWYRGRMYICVTGKILRIVITEVMECCKFVLAGESCFSLIWRNFQFDFQFFLSHSSVDRILSRKVKLPCGRKIIY